MRLLTATPRSQYRELFNTWKERGWVTFEEIQEAIPEPEAHVEELDRLFIALAEDRITVIDDSMPQSDREAMFTFMYQRYMRLVHSIAFNKLRDWGLAEEVMQEVFLNVWRSGRILNSAKGRKAWLMTVTKNKVIDVDRARSTRILEVTLEDDQHSYGVEETLVTRVDVDNAIQKLPPLQRDVVKLIYFDGLPVVDAARRLGESQNTIFSRKRLALDRLRESPIGGAEGYR